MKRAARILKIALILVGSFLVILVSLSVLMEDRVAGIVLRTLNNNFATQIKTGSYSLSLLRKFPRASFELKNIIVFSSPNFDRSGFGKTNTDTLLSARSASVDFKTIDMLKGAYTFNTINIKTGNLNIFTDSTGKYNYDIAKEKSEKTSHDKVVLNFNRINFSDVKFVYNDLRANLIIKGIFRNGRANSRVRNENIDFDGKAETLFQSFQLGDLTIRQNVPTQLEANINQNARGIFFRKCTLGFENWNFILTGFVGSDSFQDLYVTGQNIDISKIVNLLPEKYRKSASDFRPQGILKFDWKIKGKPTRLQDPHYEMNWSLKNARIESNSSRLKVDGLSFDGRYSNGSRNRPETSIFNVGNFTARFGSANYTGSFSLSDFINPKADLRLKGKLFPAEIKDFLKLENISKTSGSVDFDLKFSGNTGKIEKFRFINVFDMNSNSVVKFNSVGVNFDRENLEVRDMTGTFLIRENTTTENFRFTVNKQRINLSGRVLNLPGWLAGNKVNLTGTASVNASSLRPELFMETPSSSSEKTEGMQAKSAFNLPGAINVEMGINIDTLIYKTFTARKIAGTLSIKPKTLDFRNIKFSSQKGSIAGNGIVVQNRNKSFTGKGTFALSGVDVKEAFTTFHNFGQGFLKAENIAGSLSGTISLLLPVDSLLNPDIRSIVAEGKYTLTNGALVNFDPVKALSKFIDLSELEDIRFSRLENDFFIRNNYFYVPQMEIRSSAVDLSVNGRHSFDNDYQYHVKMLLSEILSNKARTKKSLSDEFGEIEDDGLGRTSVFLLVEGKGEEVKVSYDMKAAGNQVKEDIKKEKQTLKTIFNEEYGLYKGDSSVQKRKTTQHKFRITWEGSETSPTDTGSQIEKKENIFKKIFKKK